MLNLTTQQMRYLVAMGRFSSLNEAAVELGVSPSALSQGLSDLERRVGLSLFERRGRARTLTPRGHEMVALAERVLASTRDLSLWAERAAAGREGSIRLGLIDLAAVSLFPDELARFKTQRPGVGLHLTVASSAMLVEDLVAGRLDAAIVVEPVLAGRKNPEVDTGTQALAQRSFPGHPGLSAVDLLTDELAIYPPPDVLAKGRSALPHKSKWGPWVTFPASSFTRAQISRALRKMGNDFEVAAESHQPEVLRQLVNLGIGWTVLPVLQAESEPAPLVRVRNAGLLTRRLVIARRQASVIDPATQQLLDQLSNAAARAGSSGTSR